MGIFQANILEWVPFPALVLKQILYHGASRKPLPWFLIYTWASQQTPSSWIVVRWRQDHVTGLITMTRLPWDNKVKMTSHSHPHQTPTLVLGRGGDRQALATVSCPGGRVLRKRSFLSPPYSLPGFLLSVPAAFPSCFPQLPSSTFGTP